MINMMALSKNEYYLAPTILYMFKFSTAMVFKLGVIVILLKSHEIFILFKLYSLDLNLFVFIHDYSLILLKNIFKNI
jgi:hypothetical protein